MTSSLPFFERVRRHGDRTAVIAGGRVFTCAELASAASRLAAALLDGRGDLEEARVPFLVPPGFDYAATLLAIWQAGGVAVPLCLQHPPPEWAYVLDDTQPRAVVVHDEFADRIRSLADERSLRVINVTNVVASHGTPPVGLEEPEYSASRRALILYTSGTTSKPKGVVTTHANIQAQVESLVSAWHWSANDHILHVLPLHHIHGVVNVLLCSLWSGAICEFLPRFDARQAWHRIAHGGLTLFMAVPTIYARLIAAWEQASPEEQRIWSTAAAGLRLMVSGSAALPVATLERWRAITGHVLLERYGMTEIGMALSNS
jgi:malonyl-CoA/methylmalonyl-CoA synthetase